MNTKSSLSLSLTHHLRSKFQLWLVSGLTLSLLFLFLVANTRSGPVASAAGTASFAAGTNAYLLQYDLDRTTVPNLTYNDLTLLVNIGDSSDIEVYVDGITTSAYTYDAATDQLMITTLGDDLDIWVNHNGQPAAGFGTINVSALRDGKKWAWSHGFDDNTGLQAGISLFESYGWQGTLFMIGSLIDDTRDENWIVDRPALEQYLEGGWSVGSHGWLTNCTDYNQPAVEQSLDRLETIIAGSNRPNYKLISFAAPCFVAEYSPVIQTIRNEGNYDLQYNESGNVYLMAVDQGATDYTASGETAQAFSYSREIGRDPEISYQTPNDAIGIFDWMATNASTTNHFWYNTLAHGNSESNLATTLAHVYNNYGAAGTDEAWVAPSDHIYSYMLVRDNTAITTVEIASIPVGTTPVPNPTQGPTAIPSATPVPTNTPTPTLTPTPSGYDVLGVTLIDAATDNVAHTFYDGESLVVNLANHSEGVNLAVDTESGTQSVRFAVVVNNSFSLNQTRNGSAPYAYCTLTNGDYSGCDSTTLSTNHTYDFVISPHTSQWGSGNTGRTFALQLQIINDPGMVATATPAAPTATSPAPTATPTQSGPATATPVPPTATITPTTSPPTVTPTIMPVNPTSTPTVAPTETPISSGPSIATVQMIDASTNAVLQTINAGDFLTLNIADYPNGINFTASATGDTASISYVMTVNQSWNVTYWRNGSPFTFCASDCLSTPFRVNHRYDLRLSSFSRNWGSGTAGSTFSFGLEVVDQPAATATPNPPTATPSGPTSTPTVTPTPIAPTVTPISSGPEITSINLHNASTGAVLQTIAPGQSLDININDYPQGINFSANATTDASSIRYVMTVDQSWNVTYWRNGAPFTLCASDCLGSPLQVNHTYDFAMTPYTRNWGSGTTGTAVTFGINVIDQPAVATPTPTGPTATPTATPTGPIATSTPAPTATPTTIAPTATPSNNNLEITELRLIDAGTDQVLQTVAPGENLVINIAEYPQGINFSAVTTSGVQSVKYDMTVDQSWGVSYKRNGAPFALCSVTAQDYSSCFGSTFQANHSYDFVLTPYSKQWGTGTAGTTLSFSLDVINQPVN